MDAASGHLNSYVEEHGVEGMEARVPIIATGCDKRSRSPPITDEGTEATGSVMQIDRSDAVAELAEVFERYESGVATTGEL